MLGLHLLVCLAWAPAEQSKQCHVNAASLLGCHDEALAEPPTVLPADSYRLLQPVTDGSNGHLSYSPVRHAILDQSYVSL